MKKSFKIISVFLLMITMISTLFVVDNKTVNALESGMGEDEKDSTDFKDSNGLTIGNVTISSEGAITLTYAYGYTEFMVYAVGCSSYTEGNTACSDFNGKKWVLHLSGDFNLDEEGKPRNNTPVSKTIHLFKYFDYDEIVRVSYLVNFMSTDYGNYKPLFCNADVVDDCPSPSANEGGKNGITVAARVKNFAASIEGNVTWVIDNQYGIIYAKNIGINDGPTMRENIDNDYDKEGIVVKIDNSTVGGSIGDVQDMIFNDIIPFLMIALVVIAGVSIAVLGYQIVKAADEPEERSQKVRALKNILIGIAFAMIILFIAEPLTDFVTKFMDENYD